MTSNHYAAIATNFFHEQNTNFVPRETNPQARPVETIWQIKVYARGWEAKTIGQLKRRIQQHLRQIDMKSGTSYVFVNKGTITKNCR